MDIITYRIKHGLSQSEFAALLSKPGATQGAVSHWEKERRAITAERAVQIEKATRGAITRQHLRPDLFGRPAKPAPKRRRVA